MSVSLNVGKSVVFSALTGKYRDVSNYPGTTVEVSKGKLQGMRAKETLIDTPGADSLSPISEDEKVTRDILLGSEPDKIIQVADAKNLKRALMLFLQLSELDIPMVLDLNMMDEAKTRLIDIDTGSLSDELGIPIFETVAPERQGTESLRSGLQKADMPDVRPSYPRKIEGALDRLTEIFGRRSIAFLYLLAPDEMEGFVKERLGTERLEEGKEIIFELYEEYSQDINYLLTLSIRKKAEELVSKYVTKEEIKRTSLKGKISQLTMHPLTGIPIFLGVIFLLYGFVGYVGAQLLVDSIEGVLFGEYINPYLQEAIYGSVGHNIVSKLLVGEFGVLTVGVTWAIALILPIITTFFLAFSVLEDIGYVPRLGAMADKGLRKIGLNGKAVLPMVLGFGCDTMATMTTRVLDTKKERIIATTMLALGIPCSAQLGVIFAIMAILPVQFFLIWILVIFSQLILVAYLASKILPGRKGDFIMELPPLRIPKWKNVLRKTYYKVKMFFSEVVPFFIGGTFLIGLADITGVLDLAINGLQPIIVSWLNLPKETSVAFILGFLRRDFGAAGLLNMAKTGGLGNLQLLVSTVAITLFVPCVANFLIIIKERGLKTALAIVGFIIPFAFFVAGVLNHFLRFLGGVF